MKYLLIDGNNLAIRSAFANEGLKNSDGVPTSVHYGFFQSLIGLKQKFPDHQFLIVWDGKSERRMVESGKAVTEGIIPELYKANRKKDEMPKPLQDFYAQAPYLQRGIGQTGIPQIRLPKFEADDVVASYCKILKPYNEVVMVTSDGDYYQLLDDNASIWDGMKQRQITKDSWQSEFGIKPSQYLDVGAMMGDDGDNIFGIPGWGEKTSFKEVKRCGSWQGIIADYKKKHGDLLKKYPDYPNIKIDAEGLEMKAVEATQEEADEFKKVVTEARSEKGKLIFPEVNMSMPFARVLLAFAKEEVKMPKSEIMALVFQDRIKLAYSLKKMDDEIPDLPKIEQEEADKGKLLEYFEYYDMETLKDAIELFETIPSEN